MIKMRRFHKLIVVLPTIAALIISMRHLAIALELWSLIVFAGALIVLLIIALQPLFRRRSGRRTGLPSRYERVIDPWRALDKGEDPTQG